MSKYLELLENLKILEAERVRISNEGSVLFDCWLAESKPGGTARSQKVYWQLRSRKAQFNGKKSKYLKASEIGQYEEAIDRGKAIKQLDKQIETIRWQIEKVEAIVSSM